ncbi:hypothetical protein ACGFNX_40145 [Streptomyces sp. NPDC048723]|uniref:hypothetical protein n=1 Tax=Streptomyces sp. NPDC048723 TaxID=3365589 RepID=UPI0037206D84
MTIIATSAAPIRPQAAVDALDDVVADAFSLFDEVQGLAKLGVRLALTVLPGRIAADVTLQPESAGLLARLAGELENTSITYTPAEVGIVGSMGQGNIAVRITVGRAHLTAGDLEDLVAAVDLDPTIAAYGQADDEYMERVA